MKVVKETIILCLTILLTACTSIGIAPTIAPTDIMATAMANAWTEVAETQAAIPSITPLFGSPNPIATAISLSSTSTAVHPGETLTHTPALETVVCIPNSVTYRNFHRIDPKDFGIEMKVVDTPVLSPDFRYLAAALYEPNTENGISHLVILDLKETQVSWLDQYRALDGSYVDMLWSLDSQWIAFLPGNMANKEDGGLWIFDLTGTNRYHYQRATQLEGWDPQGRSIYFEFGGGYGAIQISTWEVVPIKNACSPP